MTVAFSGVLLKPLDQQADRDGSLIDPAGVEFDPDTDYTIFRDFNYTVPDDVVGRCRISRAADGALIATGELLEPYDIEARKFPYSLAIGVRFDTERNGSPHIPHSDLLTIGFTANHTDPTQPPVVIGIDRGAPG